MVVLEEYLERSFHNHQPEQRYTKEGVKHAKIS